VTHVVLENVQHDVSNRLDNVAICQACRTCTHEVRVADFSTLNDNGARKFEDGISPRIGRACVNRLLDLRFAQSDFLR